MEYYKQGDRTNGSYTIRPNVDLHSFEVICEFTDNAGFTVIKPENWPKNGFTFPEKTESRCTEPNCYQKKIQYGASDEQIKVSKSARIFHYFSNIQGFDWLIDKL